MFEIAYAMSSNCICLKVQKIVPVTEISKATTELPPHASPFARNSVAAAMQSNGMERIVVAVNYVICQVNVHLKSISRTCTPFRADQVITA